MIDILFGIMMIFAIIKGYRKGLIIAFFSMIALIVGLAAALKFSAILATVLENHVSKHTSWIPVVSFILVFTLAVILVNWGAKLIEKAFEVAMLGWFNKAGGIVFYALIYTIIFSVFLFYAETIHLFKPDTLQSSKVYPYVQPLGPKVIDGFGKIIPVFKDMFKELEAFFGNVSEKIPH